MIKPDVIFDDIHDITALWVNDDTDATELVEIANVAIDRNIQFVSMPRTATKTFWPWIENTNVKILNRFDFSVPGNQDLDAVVSDFATNVNSAFRDGAHGIQIFMPVTKISDFVDAILPIKNDLFFDRYISVAIDVDNMQGTDWGVIFNQLSKIRPNSVLIFGNIDVFNPKSDFAGRIFGMLENWNSNADLHLMFGKNMLRVSQVLRLVQKMRPELEKNMRVFIAHRV